MTALDLCGSALLIWIDPTTNERADLGNVRELADRANVSIPLPFDQWLRTTKGDARYAYLHHFRHSHIHHMIRQDATVQGAGVGVIPTVTVTVGADPRQPPTHERSALIQDLAEFVPERWQAFWPLFV